ncbi:Lipopolysaccharide-induced tumor necrosis factor-alpha factor [Orchesella cincta]|uniref:Lipopolysaccharide-induced tumor necrosis factor-alpha factor n=1 Tax=Orchesella cincta TaxID=48709 RepID=A0A1D2MMF0_ORCCI|nr:Lipopolysaccharide-induced tumor necrosis factor-alpha factor [Orchesella cincta]
MSAPPPPYHQDYSKPPMGYPPPHYNGNGAPPQPAPGFHLPPPQNHQPQVVIVTAPALGSHKARITCRNCRSDVETSTDKKPSLYAWICAGLMCFFGCVCGCCLIPLCVDSCMDTHHACPNCGAHCGTHRAF